MAMVTVHQWPDVRAGLREMRRVTRGPVVVLTFDGDALDRFWLADYVPELIEVERLRYPPPRDIGDALGPGATIGTVAVPRDCLDGFTEAYYARPEAFLEEATRRSQSAWGFVEDGVEERFVVDLRRDLESGAWDERYGSLRQPGAVRGSAAPRRPGRLTMHRCSGRRDDPRPTAAEQGAGERRSSRRRGVGRRSHHRASDVSSPSGLGDPATTVPANTVDTYDV